MGGGEAKSDLEGDEEDDPDGDENNEDIPDVSCL